MGVLSGFEKSRIFSDYLISNGFDRDQSVLEIGKPAESSLTTFLIKPGYSLRQFLLSDKIDYSIMDSLGLDGANGHLIKNEFSIDEEAEIFVPKTLYHDQRFLAQAPRVPYKRHSYAIPSISDFDTLICEGVPRDLSLVPYTSLNKMFGFCADMNSERLGNYMFLYKALLRCINERENDSYEMVTDRYTIAGTELCLIKKKRLYH